MRGGEAESGSNLYVHVKTGAVRTERGSKAGVGRLGEFEHVIKRRSGEKREIVSHAHLAYGVGGVAGKAKDAAQNGASEIDQEIMGRGNVSVQIVGPDAVITTFRIGDQDYYVVDSGNPDKVPNMEAQGIIPWPGDEEEAMKPRQ